MTSDRNPVGKKKKGLCFEIFRWLLAGTLLKEVGDAYDDSVEMTRDFMAEDSEANSKE